MTKVASPYGNWTEVDATSVAAIISELNLPNANEFAKWGIKVNGEIKLSGSVPTGPNDVLEVVEVPTSGEPNLAVDPDVQSS